MESITIGKLDESLIKLLRLRAAENGRMLEEEVRIILKQAVAHKKQPDNIGEAIHSHFKHLGGVELELPTRKPIREPPTFD